MLHGADETKGTLMIFALALGWFLARGDYLWAGVAFFGLAITMDYGVVAENVSAVRFF